ncbi:HNH endonuclease [Bacillus thuringiensis]|uniref:HNH endonuclease signature motif containing protein n=1 Tax=Bacillus thuringiensis TaxID=1428 RepID=UPI000BFE915E|nr:HNH endonuclease [Bacillus thuringiensis]PGW74478.1 hypothetical protein COE21_21310 [Bacillus thuringiensis]
MAIRNTKQDAANTAVRALLTAKGESCLDYKFTKDTEVWKTIVNAFSNKCAYCYEELDKKIEMEHLNMLNKDDVGLHHPGNTVPVCKTCNKRGRVKVYYTWREHLLQQCSEPIKRKLLEEKIEWQLSYYKYQELDLKNKEKISLMTLTEAREHLKSMITPSSENNHGPVWRNIKSSYNNKCAFCGESGKLSKVIINECNQTEFGTRQCANHVPACTKCKKRGVKEDTRYYSWQEHLEYICRRKGKEKEIEDRKKTITDHIKQYGYAKIHEDSKGEMKEIAKELYILVSQNVEDSIRKI